ncbi:MAG: exopolyphosphatase [Pseudomonadales bacterium]|nr:exopolyphosphatase [Pseudomonadales bacterium]
MNQIDSAKVAEGQVMAAIDMGSNSFHMVVARLQSGEVRLVQKFGEKVRLASGLDANNCLTEEAFERGLDCLRRFAQRAENIETGWLRCVGTNTLRKARNGNKFISEAEKIIGCPVQVVAGREEARLIYLGVSHSLPTGEGKRLVFDIGGGSTEFIIGSKFEPRLTESLHMGCVSYRDRFFPDGQLSEWHFFRAVMAARREILAIAASYKEAGWQHVVGASGTVKAIRNAIVENELGDETITRESLQRLIEKVLSFKTADDIDIAGVKPDRRSVLPSGLAILTGVVEGLGIDAINYSDGALREGVLYDMLGRLEHENVCERTMGSLMSRYGIDECQAKRVKQTALQAFDQVRVKWELDDERYRNALGWAALTHEIGLAISHAGFHRHGAYLLMYSDLAGFSREEQLLMGVLVGGHRRKIKQQLFEEVSESDRIQALKATLLLRIAVNLHRSRRDSHLPSFLMVAEKQQVNLQFPEKWLDEHPLTCDELQQEKEIWAKIGYELNFE